MQEVQVWAYADGKARTLQEYLNVFYNVDNVRVIIHKVSSLPSDPLLTDAPTWAHRDEYIINLYVHTGDNCAYVAIDVGTGEYVWVDVASAYVTPECYI